MTRARRQRFTKKLASMIAALTALAVCLAAIGLWLGWWSLNMFSARAYDVWGLDVSHHNGRIDWAQVARDPRIRFVYVKASEGDDWSDSTFTANFHGARHAGLAVGAYHFFSFCSEPAAQLAHFLKVSEPGTLPPMVDVELSGACHAMGTDAEVRARLKKFLALLEKSTGRRPIVYATNEAYDRFVKDYGLQNPLWLRDIWHEPAPGWAVWQFANRGHVRGVSGYVDLNAFAGSDLSRL